MLALNRRGRPRAWPVPEIINAIFDELRGGIAWCLLLRDLPPKSTAVRWFSLRRDTGLFMSMPHLLLIADRESRARSIA